MLICHCILHTSYQDLQYLTHADDTDMRFRTYAAAVALEIIHLCIPQLGVCVVLIASPLRMQELPAAEGMFGVTNDGPLMRSVCDKLAKAPAHTALESDVKAALSFTRKVQLTALK